MVGLPSETHLKFYQVDIEDFDNEVNSYEVEARNDEEAALTSRQIRQVRDVCIFRIYGMGSFPLKAEIKCGEFSLPYPNKLFLPKYVV